MPTRTDEGPPLQRDRVTDPDRDRFDEPRNFEMDRREGAFDPDTASEPFEDEDINTHGSER